ncbi:hypothetical protein CCHR01_19816 [Colletotrichum chrysophilum]|uniref:Uncharacterized protein n=1 Tax=Colletotrichum chrysophilum TaxID=1836956 RepID=A0AAD8ZXL4_9PEZI|nr:hypothetical protein CCHR01_19816 [Colletotrichum chrysophilum]
MCWMEKGGSTVRERGAVGLWLGPLLFRSSHIIHADMRRPTTYENDQRRTARRCPPPSFWCFLFSSILSVHPRERRKQKDFWLGEEERRRR